MLGGNAAALYGFDLDVLAPFAAQFGPLVADTRSSAATGRAAHRGIQVPGLRRATAT